MPAAKNRSAQNLARHIHTFSATRNSLSRNLQEQKWLRVAIEQGTLMRPILTTEVNVDQLPRSPVVPETVIPVPLLVLFRVSPITPSQDTFTWSTTLFKSLFAFTIPQRRSLLVLFLCFSEGRATEIVNYCLILILQTACWFLWYTSNLVIHHRHQPNVFINFSPLPGPFTTGPC